MSVTRRRFIAGALGSTSAIAGPAILGRESARAKVVVIGGGVGGAIAAKYTRILSRNDIDVTLIEPQARYVTCVHSNFVIRGLKSLRSISFGYGALSARYGIHLVTSRAVRIDPDARKVYVENGSEVAYDALVLSPGISLDYGSVPGWSRAAADVMPHGWIAGAQTLLLKQRLAAVPDGGLVILLAPPNPYRCPPAPYERVSLMARELLATGRRRCKIIVLDAKRKFADQALFQDGWDNLFPGMIEWIDVGIYETIDRVEPSSNSVVTGFETYRNAALVNVIPRQTAGQVAHRTGLTDASGFCPVAASTMLSKLDTNTYIIGDACDCGPMPKSASGARLQAKLVAATVCERFGGRTTYKHGLESMCFSAIDDDYAIKALTTYEVTSGRIQALNERITPRTRDARAGARLQAENMAWYDGFFADVFN